MAASGSLVKIDGAYGEGGGALIRTALAMAALTQQPVRIEQVRGATNFPGLDIEDLTLLGSLSRSCAAETMGAELKSPVVSFLPTRKAAHLSGSLDVQGEEEKIRVPNANVILNSMLPVLARSGAYSQVNLNGETYGNHSLGYDYFANVTIGALKRLGLYAFPEQLSAGFGREGGGEVHVDVEPSCIGAVDWSSRGDLIGARAVITICELPMTIAHRGMAHLTNLGINSKIAFDGEIIGVNGRKPGLSVTVWAEYERGMGGASALGAKGIRAEAVAQAAFEDLLEWIRSDSSIDPFLADQIIPAAILADGESTFKVSRITRRLQTIIWVIKQFIPIHITVKGSEGEPGEIKIRR
jgi:RNA 3'-terminal phosphate cyclase (ATP)